MALVDPDTLAVTDFSRHPLESTGPLAAFTGAIDAALADLPRPLPAAWAIALPGPFDYAAGIGGRHPGGKLQALAGQDVRALLRPLLGTAPVTFVNDALAFGLGSAAAVAASGVRRVLALTFGSGIGSAFVEDGLPVADDRVPPGGEVYALEAAPGLTIEARFGPAALAGRHGCASFAELAGHARENQATLQELQHEFVCLADALAPWLEGFAPEVIACGGGVVRAWDLFGDPFAERLALHAPTLRTVSHEIETEATAIRGAVAYATAVGPPSDGAVE